MPEDCDYFALQSTLSRTARSDRGGNSTTVILTRKLYQADKNMTELSSILTFKHDLLNCSGAEIVQNNAYCRPNTLFFLSISAQNGIFGSCNIT